uniref:Uncharacterized protein n=1 Tax=Glossina palpalis gambiensis TaxID=67801 RepID=A0A1B0BH41_9MUSC
MVINNIYAWVPNSVGVFTQLKIILLDVKFYKVLYHIKVYAGFRCVGWLYRALVTCAIVIKVVLLNNTMICFQISFIQNFVAVDEKTSIKVMVIK